MTTPEGDVRQVIEQLRGVEALALGLMIPAMDRGEQRPLTVTELGEVAVACGTAAVALEALTAQPGEALLNPVNQVYFRAGLLACREYMARFVEVQDPSIAQSIRANWWPRLGADPGPPRKMEWSELTEGEFGTAGFRCRTAEEVSPSIEALPVALGFLELPPTGQNAVDALPPAPQPTTNEVGDVVCQHGTAMDVHCCNCHSGFLFDASACVCVTDGGVHV